MSINWTRKPSSFSDVTTCVTVNYLTAFLKGKKLPTITVGELWNGAAAPLKDFKRPMPTLFFLERFGVKYLVSTEGSNYCRYMAQVVAEPDITALSMTIGEADDIARLEQIDQRMLQNAR